MPVMAFGGGGMRKFFYLIAVLGLGACTAPGQRFEMPTAEAPQDTSRLIVYSTEAYAAWGKSAVLLDGAVVCSLHGSEVMELTVSPGDHQLGVHTRMTPGTSVMPFKAEAGKTTYISASTNAKRVAASFLLGIPGTFISSDHSTPRGGNLFVEQVSEDEAKKETAKMTRCDCKPPKASPKVSDMGAATPPTPSSPAGP